MTVSHNVSTEPVNKLDGGTIGYKFKCSCGREGKGYHSTEKKAIEAGKSHIKE